MAKRRVTLHIPSKLVSKPMMFDVVKNFDVSFNILRAQVLEDQDGVLTIELTGSKPNVNSAIEQIIQQGVKVSELSRDIRRDEERCTHCGVCVGQCPTGALHVSPVTYEVSLDEKKCILCELCVPACIYNALTISHSS